MREGGTQEVLGGGRVPTEVGKGLAWSQVKREVLSEKQTSPGKCYMLTSGAALPGRATCPHLLPEDVSGSRGSLVIARAELNGQLE